MFYFKSRTESSTGTKSFFFRIFKKEKGVPAMAVA